MLKYKQFKNLKEDIGAVPVNNTSTIVDPQNKMLGGSKKTKILKRKEPK